MDNPFLELPALAFGARPELAPLTAILLHGRGRSPAEMLIMARQFDLPDIAWLALRAPEASWYPGRFLQPRAFNQPSLDQAIERIEQEVSALEAQGVARDRVLFIGFSQGACTICEYLARHPGRYAGVIGFTGGLPTQDDEDWNRTGTLAGTPILLTNSDADEWIPWPRTQGTAEAFTHMGAEVTTQLYPGREHLVSEEEMAQARALLSRLLG